jgi:hypothetical protein
MTRAKDISKIVTDADLSGTLDVTGEVTTADDIKFTSGSRHKFVGGGTGNNLELGTYSSNNTSRDVHLQIDSAGNVGIGTSSPNSRLTSASTDGSTGLSIHRTFSGNVSGETTIGGLDFTLTDTATSNQVVSRISPVGSAGTGDAFAGAMRFYTAGTNGSIAERMRIDSSGNVGIGISNPDDKLHVADSSNAELKLQTDNANGGSVVKFNRSGTDNSYIGTKGYFLGNSDNNLYLRANSGLGIQFYTNGNNQRMSISSNGHVSVGTTDDTYGFNVGGSGSDVRGKFQGSNQYRLGLQNGTSNLVWLGSGGADNFRISNSSGSTRFEIDSSGNASVISGTIGASGSYSNTTGSSANVHILSSGVMVRSTSSLRYKNTINDATHGLTELLTLRPVTYKGNNDGDTVFGGLIAEEVHDAGLTEFVQYNDDGEPDALAYGNMVSLCVKAIQELKAELDSAKARITALENGE